MYNSAVSPPKDEENRKSQALEWVSKDLRHYQDEEIAVVERMAVAVTSFAKAKTELAAAKEELAGVRGSIAEFTWQMKYVEEHGRLP
jgi:hypothetical protein